MIYASENYSLAMLELFVHLRPDRIPAGRIWSFVSLTGMAVDWLDEANVRGWERKDYRASRRAGDAWLDSGAAPILSVPSVVARYERNLLINPRHKAFAEIVFPTHHFPVIWDKRLFA